MDNGAYDAKYDVSKAIPLDAKLMTEGTHVLRVFPSAGPADSKGARWHESRKNEGAFAWVRFHVVADGGDLKGFDGTKPLLTYSRPKGEYKLSGPDKPLLFPLMVDFYVTNCTLAKDGYHVRATVDGKAQPDYTEWKPYSVGRHGGGRPQGRAGTSRPEGQRRRGPSQQVRAHDQGDGEIGGGAGGGGGEGGEPGAAASAASRSRTSSRGS